MSVTLENDGIHRRKNIFPTVYSTNSGKFKTQDADLGLISSAKIQIQLDKVVYKILQNPVWNTQHLLQLQLTHLPERLYV